jgi:hypothetical protein
MIISLSLVMLNTAQAYWDLGCYAEVESVATKTKDVLEAAGLTKCYVFAECLSCLANCHNAKALYGAAEEAAKAALTVYSQCVSKYHPSVGTGSCILCALFIFAVLS